jgi:hypothetical protein
MDNSDHWQNNILEQNYRYNLERKDIYQAGGMTRQKTVVTEQKDDQYHRFTALLAVRKYFGTITVG